MANHKIADYLDVYAFVQNGSDTLIPLRLRPHAGVLGVSANLGIKDPRLPSASKLIRKFSAALKRSGIAHEVLPVQAHGKKNLPVAVKIQCARFS